jgi:hypothetical protein
MKSDQQPDLKQEKTAWKRYCKESSIDIAKWPYKPFDPKRHELMYPEN